MADFTKALKRTLRHEGGYANIKADRGGETYKGIARDCHPHWPGWAIIAVAKSAADFPSSLDRNSQLQSLVADFYKTEFWDKIAADTISSQPIANELFDCAVNMGVVSAVRILQRSLNCLIPPDSAPLAEDGILGPKTLPELESWLKQNALHPQVAVNALLALMLVLRGEQYVNIIERNPSQKQFAYGWFRRIFNDPQIQRRSSQSETPA
jgi:lysozyme family protein